MVNTKYVGRAVIKVKYVGRAVIKVKYVGRAVTKVKEALRLPAVGLVACTCFIFMYFCI
jgi:hypothetical protein